MCMFDPSEFRTTFLWSARRCPCVPCIRFSWRLSTDNQRLCFCDSKNMHEMRKRWIPRIKACPFPECVIVFCGAKCGAEVVLRAGLCAVLCARSHPRSWGSDSWESQQKTQWTEWYLTKTYQNCLFRWEDLWQWDGGHFLKDNPRIYQLTGLEELVSTAQGCLAKEVHHPCEEHPCASCGSGAWAAEPVKQRTDFAPFFLQTMGESVVTCCNRIHAFLVLSQFWA